MSRKTVRRVTAVITTAHNTAIDGLSKKYVASQPTATNKAVMANSAQRLTITARTFSRALFTDYHRSVAAVREP
jgi:hypothetical protein